MKTRFLSFANVIVFGCAVSLALIPSYGLGAPDTKAGAPAAAATEDILHMSDGRVLHGQIISKTKEQVVFEYRDLKLNIKTRLTVAMDGIAKIEEDVAVEAGATTPAATPGAETGAAKIADKGKPANAVRREYGASRIQTDNPDVPSIYIVPMKGQMGTDINATVYEKVKEDIKLRKPDLVVIEMSCQDEEDVLYSTIEREEMGLADLDEFKKMVNLFQDDLAEFDQVRWVHDSVGISSAVALSWGKLYMKPTGRFGGLITARQQAGFANWADADVRGKMTDAYMAWIKSFLESGKYSLVLADAMVRPEKQLSATWKGREVVWSLDDKGEYLVDGSDKKTTEFRAKDAEDLCLSDGTADTLDDLALLLGHREYRVLDGQAEKLCADYVEDWRRAYEKAKVLFEDYKQFQGWAGSDPVKYLGKMKAALEDILAAMERYKPIETRLGREYGVSKADLIVLIEKIKEQLRGLKGAGGGSKGGGGGGGGGGLSPGTKPR